MSGLQMHAAGQLSDPTYIHAMLEQTAETLDKLQRSIMRDDVQRRQVSEQIQGLGEKLAVFVDQSHDEQRLMAMLSKGQSELAPVLSRLVEQQSDSESALHTHVRNLDINIKRLADNLSGGREQLSDDIRDELRLIARALSAEAHGRGRHQGKSRAG
jgi:Mg2+ and Co2+ transporter CorA